MTKRHQYRYSKSRMDLYEQLWKKLSSSDDVLQRRDYLLKHPFFQDEVGLIKGRNPLLKPLKQFDADLAGRAKELAPELTGSELGDFLFYVWHHDAIDVEFIAV